MAEPFDAGQDPERGEREPVNPGQDGDDAIEGTVVLFPKQPGQEVEPARKPGGPGELRPVIPHHLRTVAGVKKAARWRVRRR